MSYKNLDNQILNIPVNIANFDHITKSGKINGALFMDIKSLLIENGKETQFLKSLIKKHEQLNGELIKNTYELIQWSRSTGYFPNAIIKLESLLNDKQTSIQCSEWFRIFYTQVVFGLKYYFDLNDVDQMKHAQQLYDLGMSPEDAAWDYVGENNRQD